MKSSSEGNVVLKRVSMAAKELVGKALRMIQTGLRRDITHVLFTVVDLPDKLRSYRYSVQPMLLSVSFPMLCRSSHDDDRGVTHMILKLASTGIHAIS